MMDRLENFDTSDLLEFVSPPKIKVVGVGGAGSNIVERLYGKGITGVETIALNTDAGHLNLKKADQRKVLGAKRAFGRGAGGDPHLGSRCAEDDEDSLRGKIEGADMVFVIAGMGKGTGTGSSPVIAKYARESDALVVGVALLPFMEESQARRKIALDGILELKKYCHCVVELDNEKINTLKGGEYPMQKALNVMSDFVAQMVKSLSEIVTEPSTINVDFADLRKIIEAGGSAKVLYGESENTDPGSVLDSVLGNPLLESQYQGAEAVLLHISAGSDFSLNNCHEVLSALRYELSEDVNLIWGLRDDVTSSSTVKVVMLVTAIPDNDMDFELRNSDFSTTLGESVQMIN